ncbi:MAG: BamA/TamA family outer membrane protein [Bacteroidia bacterium]
MKKKKIIHLSVFVVLLLSSCTPFRKLGENQVLLVKNKINVDKTGLKDEITSIVKQKPNRKMLGLFRFHLGVYDQFNFGKETKLKAWFKRTIGEPPVLLDTVLIKRSSTQIKQFMHNSGYFHAEVKDTVIYKSKQKAIVNYTIKSNVPYTILNFSRFIASPPIDSIVTADSQNCLVKPGQVYDNSILQGERERITSLLKNKGYYFFNQQYISFKIDSSLHSNHVNVYMFISNPDPDNYPDNGEGTDEIMVDTTVSSENVHHSYSLNKIIIRSDYDPLTAGTLPSTDTIFYKGYIFISASHNFNFKPYALSDHIFLNTDSLYRLDDHENTYRSLSDLGNFRFINIKFEADSQPGNLLNCIINLTPLQKQSYKVELEGTLNGGNKGAAGNFIYSNRNTFNGAETFSLKLKTAVEDLENTTVPEEGDKLFNTYEYGLEGTLTLPRVPSIIKPKNKAITTSTNYTASYNIQNRPEFFRRIADFSVGFAKKYSSRSRLQVNVAEVNFVNVTPDPVFEQKLIDIGDPALISSYEDHLIADGRANFLITTQALNKTKNFIFFRTSFESAGFSIRMVDMITGKVTNRDSSYTVFKNPYAQYIRQDVDFRFYHILNKNNTLVYRIAMGIGIPYWNSQELPFEKSYFAGGANDLRAFNARSIGPGSYFKEQVQQNGEIKINGNVEYRFDIFKILQGALFADAGNVWLKNEDADRPGGKFLFDKFYKEIAIGGGVGFRFNFTFFIFRVDLGYKFRDPTLPENERWVFKDFNLFDPSVSNIGIGYPF